MKRQIVLHMSLLLVFLLTACPQPTPVVSGVTVEPELLQLQVGESGQLTATVDGDNNPSLEVSWSSLDEAVASVDNNGKVMALGRGSTMIKAVSVADSSKSGMAQVEVLAPALELSTAQLEAAVLVNDTTTTRFSISNQGDAQLSVELNTTAEWLSLAVLEAARIDSQALSINIAPGASQLITLTMDASGLTAGTEEARVELSSNDPETPSTGVSVVLTIWDPEPNESIDEALPVTLDFEAELALEPGDVDWFAIELSEPMSLSIEVVSLVFIDSLMSLRDADGVELAFSDDTLNSVDPAIDIALLAGRYFLAVSGFPDFSLVGDHFESGAYRLRISQQAAPDLIVTPAQLFVEIEQGGTAETQFMLTNTGDSPLDFSITDGFDSSALQPLAVGQGWGDLLDLGLRTTVAIKTQRYEPQQLETILSDAIGDSTGTPDLLALEAAVIDEMLNLRVVVAPDSLNPNTLAGVLELDLDQNFLTGQTFGICEGQLIGPEIFLVFQGEEASLSDGFDFFGSYPVVYDDADGFSTTVPLVDLDDDGNLDVTAVFGDFEAPHDCMPDQGRGTIGEPGVELDPVSVAPTSGSLALGESLSIDVSVDAGDLPGGTQLVWPIVVTSATVPDVVVDLAIIVTLIPDAFEPNNSPETATPVSLPLDEFLTLTPGDIDFFSVELTESQLLRVNVSEVQGNMFPFIGLATDEGPFAFGFGFLEQTLAPGRYFVVISDEVDFDFTGNHASQGSYRLALELADPPSGGIEGRVLTPLMPLSPERLGIPADAEFMAGQVLVKFRSEARRSLAIADLGLIHERRVGQDVDLLRSAGQARRTRASAAEAQDTLALIAALRARPDVVYAEPNYLRFPLLAPNDERYGEQWHYQQIDLEAAWDLSTGSPEVSVAILDTGIAAGHPEFNCGRSLPGFDFIDQDDNPEDEGPDFNTGFHGSHVQGTVGACTDNAVGVAGVDWQARLMPVRVLGPEFGTEADIANGILWAAGLPVAGVEDNPNPVDVINMSLGGFGSSRTMQDAIIAADDAGTIVVVAAGNEIDDARFYSPAGLARVITVAASDRTGELAWYSNFGSAVEITAPGGDTSLVAEDGVLSTLADDSGSFFYGFYQGTSMASPHVAGVIALMKSLNPDLTSVRATAYLQDTASPFADDSRCRELGCGAGLLNAPAALQAALNNDPIPAFLRLAGETNFGADLSELTVTLSNLGDASTDFSIRISHPAVSSNVTEGSLAAQAQQELVLSLDRGSLADSGYQLELVLSYGTENLVVPLRFQVGAGIEDVGDIMVELITFNDSGFFFSDQLVTFEEGYVFSFNALADRAYDIAAFSDTAFGFQSGIVVRDGQLTTGVEVLLEEGPVFPEALRRSYRDRNR